MMGVGAPTVVPDLEAVAVVAHRLLEGAPHHAGDHLHHAALARLHNVGVHHLAVHSTEVIQCLAQADQT